MIEEAVFDISFDAGPAASLQQDGLNAFLQDALLPIADEIFGELSAGGTMLRIDQLEVDLGDVDFGSFHEEMADRFRVRLRSALQGKMQELTTSASRGEYVLDRKQAERRQLESFLENGYLLRQGMADDGVIERILRGTVRENPRAFFTYLERSPRRDIILKRMANQLPASVLEEIIRSLAPMRAANAGKSFVEQGGARKERRGRGAEKEWTRRLGNLFERDDGIAPEHSLPAGRDKQAEFGTASMLHARLESAMARGEAGGIMDDWPALLRDAPELLRESFMERMGDARLRRKLAAGFPAFMLLGLTGALDREAGAFIGGLLELAGAPRAEGENGNVGTAVHAALWELTLDNLHAAGGGGFDWRSYTQDLLEKLRVSGCGQEPLARMLESCVAEKGGTAAQALQRVREAGGQAETREKPDEAGGKAAQQTLLPHVAAQLPGEALKSEAALHVESAEEMQADGVEEHIGFLRARLEAALVQGKAGGIAGEWEELLRGHAEMVREVFARKMGVARARRRLARGFPDAMLFGLAKLLAPSGYEFLERLFAQAELRREPTPGWSAEGTVHAALWEYTLGKLHVAGTNDFDRAEYAREVVEHLVRVGLERGDILLALARADVLAGEGCSSPVLPLAAGETRNPLSAGEDAAARYRMLEQRLRSGAGREMLREIADLAGGPPELLLRLRSQLQSGELVLRGEALTTGEVKQLVLAFAGLSGAGAGEVLLREIGMHEAGAHGERDHYLRELEGLLHERAAEPDAVASDVRVESLSEGFGGVESGSGAYPPGKDEPGVSGEPELESSGRSSAHAKGDSRGGILYWKLRRRLRSGEGNEMSREIGELAAESPELLARLQRQLQSGELLVRKDMMTAGEVKHLVLALAGLSGESARDALLREAGSDDGRDYYLQVFEDMLHKRGSGSVVTNAWHRQDAAASDGRMEGEVRQARPEGAGGDAVAGDAASAESETVQSPVSRERSGFLRARLEAALAQGKAELIFEEWEKLLVGHAEMVRTAFMRMMGEARSRQRLARGFPDAMLLGLARLLAPSGHEFMEQLFAQGEFRPETASGEHGGVALRSSLWEYTLGKLHAAGVNGFDLAEYARGVVEHLVQAGLERADILRALARAEAMPSVAGGSLAGQFAGREEAETEGQPGADSERVRQETQPGAWQHVEEIYQRLLRRLEGAAAGEMAQEIADIAREHPELFRRLRRQLHAGEVTPGIARLASQEARLFVFALVDAAGETGPDSMTMEFRREIEKHAASAKDEGSYYRHILGSLARNGVVDLEKAMSATPTGEHVALPGTGAARAGFLCERLEQALVQGDSTQIEEYWEEMSKRYADMQREAFMGCMGDAQVRLRVARNFPLSMLLDLVGLFAPEGRDFIGKLSALAGSRTEQAASVILWEHTLAILHAGVAHGFRRAEYAGRLVQLLVGHEAGNERLLQALEEAGARRDEGAESSGRGSALKQDSIAPFGGDARAPGGAGRIATLYRRLQERFSGSLHEEIGSEIKELAGTAPELLAELVRKFRDGEIAQDVSALSLSETQCLVEFFVASSGGGSGGEFARAIEAHALSARDALGYYRYILDRLLRDEAVDVEEAMKRVASVREKIKHEAEDEKIAGAGTRPDAAQNEPPGDAGEVHGVMLQRRLLQLLRGGAGEMSLEIEELVRSHPRVLWHVKEEVRGGGIVPDVSFLSLMGARRLVEFFAASSSGEFWRAIEAHALGARDAVGYYRYVLGKLLRDEAVDIEEAKKQVASAREEAEREPEDEEIAGAGRDGISPELSDDAGEARGVTLRRKLLQRLRGGAGDMSSEIEELVRSHPRVLEQVREEILGGELEPDVSVLSLTEAQRLLEFFVASSWSVAGGEFARAIKGGAAEARDVASYYRHILEQLLRGEAVNTEAATASAGNGDGSASSSRAGEKALFEKGREEIAAPARQETKREAEDKETAGIGKWQDAVLDEPPADAGEARGAMLQRRLLQRLRGGAGEMSREIDELARSHRRELEQVKEAIRSGGFALDVSALSQTEAQHLVEFFVATSGSVAGGEFVRAIEAHAAEMHDAANYYRHILGKLLRDEAVDLEAVSASAGGGGGPVSSSRAGEKVLLEKEREEVAAPVRKETKREAEGEKIADAGRRQGAALDETPGDAGEARGITLRSKLLQRLRGTAGEMAREIEELAWSHPELPGQVLKEMRDGVGEPDVAALSLAEAQRLVELFVVSSAGGSGGEFARAIEAHAAGARDAAVYYRYILDKLLRDEAVDLEAAAERTVPELEGAGETPPPGREEKMGQEEDTRETARSEREDGRRGGEDEPKDEIYIANAGMVLLTAYLPRLFTMLELTSGSKFRDERAAERAAHLLQYAVNGSCDSPEFLLPLNKLMCGIPMGAPIVREIEVSQKEREAIEGMLKAVIQHWKVIGNTSVSGLQESFLQRAGRLQLVEDTWRLKVESKGIDVLLDQLPWGYAFIRHPWMARPISVEWR